MRRNRPCRCAADLEAGGRIAVTFEMEARLTRANPLLRDDIGKVAVERGPLVYAAEGLDQAPGTTAFDLQLAGAGVSLGVEIEPAGGIVRLAHAAVRARRPSREQALYDAADEKRAPTGEMVLIPYHAYQNRGTTSTAVWLPYRELR